MVSRGRVGSETRVAAGAHGECWHRSWVGNGEVAWGEVNRWVGKEIKREKERARNRKMKGLVAPWQQLYEFPQEPQPGTGIFLGRHEVCNALLVLPPRAGILPSLMHRFPSQALSPHCGLRLDSPIRPLPEKFWLCVNFATYSTGEKRWGRDMSLTLSVPSHTAVYSNQMLQ